MSQSATGTVELNLVEIGERRIFHARVTWHGGRIGAVEELGPEKAGLGYLLAGFIDAHIHIESSMLTPAEFGRTAVCHGTVATVSDPHEIANVLGVEGIRLMLDNARQTPFHAFFGAPSCVPATPFETTRGSLGPAEIETLFAEPEVNHLSEMMNYPGVINREPEVEAKLAIARRLGYPVDGHAPGLKGEQAKRYAAAGITTDHECFSLEEARDKIAAGMWILIREGSAARNFNALHPLISEHPERVMFCSDDKHPDDLLQGHIDRLVARAVAAGHDLFEVLQCACINPIDHYRLPLGRLRAGDPMDAVEVTDLYSFLPRRTWLNGTLVASEKQPLLEPVPVEPANCFHARRVSAADFEVPATGHQIRVIGVQDGELVTRERVLQPLIREGLIIPDPAQDILPICVVNRYRPEKPALGFIQGFGLQRGAIGSSVAHDSHNIIALGADIPSLVAAINTVIDHQGGIVVAADNLTEILPLPVAGIMSDRPGEFVGPRYARLDQAARALGSRLCAPFMTLSFMALLVIPELKLSDQGLFDGRRFTFTDLSP